MLVSLRSCEDIDSKNIPTVEQVLQLAELRKCILCGVEKNEKIRYQNNKIAESLVLD
jgi:hypothetical protein